MLILDDDTPMPERKPVDRAAWLFPESEYLQREWRRAVRTVRGTERGWLLDKPVQKKERQ